jgi:hypothetical protein
MVRIFTNRHGYVRLDGGVIGRSQPHFFFIHNLPVYDALILCSVFVETFMVCDTYLYKCYHFRMVWNYTQLIREHFWKISASSDAHAQY